MERWQDFAPRFVSGAVLALVGLLCIWFGGWVFLLLVTVVITLMVWELQHMVSLPQTAPVGVLLAGHRARGGIVLAATHLPLPLPGAREVSL